MRQRRDRPKDAGIRHENIKLSPALIDCRAKHIDLVTNRQIKLNQCGRTAKAADLIVKVLQSANAASGDDDMRPLSRQRHRHRAPNPA